MKPFQFQKTLSGDSIILKQHPLETAELMFSLVEKDRTRLEQFLPWVPRNKTLEDQKSYIQFSQDSWLNKTMFDYSMYLNNGEYLGNIGVHTLAWQHDACEIGYWITSKHEGKGYVSQALKILESYLFAEGFNRVQIKCSSNNLRSSAVPERNGYLYEGLSRQDTIEKGAYRDTKTYAKLTSDYIAELKSPLIRRARHLDAAGIIQAHVRSIREVCAKDYRPEQIAAWSGRDFQESRSRENMDKNHVWVIDDGKNIQGFSELMIKENGIGEIRGLYITPEVIGQGLGSKLLAANLYFSRFKKLNKIFLSSTITSIKFYEKHGFIAIGPRDATPIGGVPIDSQNMELILRNY
jgi:ribosomal-protein-serine acetyltransferase